jgi:drug/metabolite transporter (DMT)-like permease
MSATEANLSGIKGMASICGNRVYVYCVLLIWLTLSVSLVMLNKYILSASRFPYPITLAFSHMLAATIATAGVPKSYALWGKFALVAGFFACSLTCALAALIYLPVSTVQMLKLAGPVTSFATGLLLGIEHFSWLYALKISVISIGVGVATYGDASFHWQGVTLQMLSILFDAIRCSRLQQLLHYSTVKLSPVGTLAHIAPCTVLVLSAPMAVLEFPSIKSNMLQPTSCGVAIAVSSVLAILLNLVIFEFISVTSALTANVSAILKDFVIIWLAASASHVQLTYMQLGGYALALAGLAWYQHEKMSSSSAGHQQKPTGSS